MEKSNKRGKIPQSDWPLIMARYDAGETLASIARTYDCSPPAISYVVSRSRTRQPDASAAPKPATIVEPQLIKTAPAEAVTAPLLAAALSEPEAPAGGLAPKAPAVAPEPAGAASGDIDGRRNGAAPHNGNGLARGLGNGAPPNPPSAVSAAQRPAPPINGDHRRTLHLSLGTPQHGNGAARPAEPQTAGAAAAGRDLFAAPRANGGGENAKTFPIAAEGKPDSRPDLPQPHNGNGASRSEHGSAFIDQELRSRVAGDIDAFLGAFDAALAHDSSESRAALREATDRLLRAGARTRIELERLDARVPLTPRDGAGRGGPAWRER